MALLIGFFRGFAMVESTGMGPMLFSSSRRLRVVGMRGT